MPFKEITSAQNAVVKGFRKAKRAKGSRELGVFMLEGRHLLKEALRTAWPIEAVLITHEAVGEWENALVESGMEERVFRVGAPLLDNLSSLRSNQGVLALGKRLRTPMPECTPGRLYLFLEEVQDPVNVGMLVRSAYAFGFAGVFLGAGTADAFGPTALARSAGASLHVQPLHCALPGLLAWLSGGDGVLLAADADGDPLNAKAALEAPLVLALGNEGRGLSPDLLAAARRRVSIPMRSGWNSLNVAAAGAILMYELSAGASVKRPGPA